MVTQKKTDYDGELMEFQDGGGAEDFCAELPRTLRQLVQLLHVEQKSCVHVHLRTGRRPGAAPVKARGRRPEQGPGRPAYCGGCSILWVWPHCTTQTSMTLPRLWGGLRHYLRRLDFSYARFQILGSEDLRTQECLNGPSAGLLALRSPRPPSKYC
jgi:hypothetical protein